MRTKRSPIFRNGDEATRELERAYQAEPNRAVLSRLMRAYARTGQLRRMWLEAVDERQAAADAVYGTFGEDPGVPGARTPRYPGQAEQEIAAVQQEAMAALRAADPRIRRSRRRNLASLSLWAEQILGRSRAKEIVEPFEERSKVIVQAAQARLTAAKARLAELAYYARPEPGPISEWEFHGEIGRYGEENTARRRAINKVRLARQLGLEAGLERRPGELVPGTDHRGRPTTVRRGDGWATFVGTQGPADLELIQELHELRFRLSHEYYTRLKDQNLGGASVFDTAYAELDQDLGLPPAVPLERQLEVEANASVAQAHARLAP